MKHIAFLVSSTLILAACGSSNPGQTHPVTVVPGYDNKVQKTAPPQVRADARGPFSANVDGKVGQMSANFVAGQKGTAAFHVDNNNPDIGEYDITNLTGAIPRGATLKRTDKNTWIFTWTPPITFPSSKLELTFNAHAVASESPYDVMNSISQNFTFVINLGNTSQAPTFKTISQDLTRLFQEGDVIPFTVDVIDSAAAQNKQTPVIKIIPSSLLTNPELAPVDGSKLVRADESHPQVDQVSPGVFRAYFILDTGKNLPWPRLKLESRDDTAATVALACFDVVAEDAMTKQNMEATDFCPQITYANSKPTIAWDAGTQFVLKALAPATLNFSIQASGPHSVISYKNISKTFSTWPGKPEVTCDTANPLNFKCKLNWTPTCSPQSKAYSFSVSATAGMEGSTRKAPAPAILAAQTITVESDTCPVTPVKAVEKKAVPTKKTAATTAKSNSQKTTDSKTSATPVAKQGA